MRFLRMFGIGAANAIAGVQTEGTVTRVQTCFWFKVNTKPVRLHVGDGAVYPHILHFTYQAEGQTYTGTRWVQWNRRCPVKDEKITVYYEKGAPEKYAVIL
jgi:hypothetical protein